MLQNKRYMILFYTFLVLLLMLSLKIFKLQVINGAKYTAMAEKQRTLSNKLTDVRGNIYDRNMIPFTNRSEKIYRFDKLGILAHGVNRYDDDSIARHVTGYLKSADNKGVTGIEGFYDKYLSKGGVLKLMTIKDASGKPISGLGYRISEVKDEQKPFDIMLTLDFHVQDICENVLSNCTVPAAVVVQDVSTGDVLAMVSKPEYEHGNITGSLDSTSGEFLNRSTAGYNLGSVFKIVVTAAALEAGIDLDFAYYCSGSVQLGSREINCYTHARGGHGAMDLQEAFAYSCNTFFIDLGQKLGYKKITQMAAKLGFGVVTGINDQGISEMCGYLNLSEIGISPGDTANLSIGQGSLLATPMQVARMISTIANGGVMNKTNIVDGLLNSDGAIIKSFHREGSTQVISPDIAAKLRFLMQQVVERGTGTAAGSELIGGAGGKTGSAETGVFDDTGKQIVHSWFAGYYPANSPQYSITVFAENGVGKSIAATSLFNKIAKEISTIN